MQFTRSIENEVLSQNEVEAQLRQRLAEINALLDLKLKALKKSPEGSLRIAKNHNVLQYYHRKDPQNKNGDYIAKKNFKLAQALAQKEYDKALVSSLQKEAKCLKKTLRSYDNFFKQNTIAEKLIERLNKNKRSLVKPVHLSDEDFEKYWKSIPYQGLPFAENYPNHITPLGERVRSKSEVLIAITLQRLHIPYRYEYPIEIKNENDKPVTFYPDFLCLNLRTRREFIWEHFGLMDDPEYACKAAYKIGLFNQNGIFAGKNLITTMETAEHPLNSKQIEKLIGEYLV
ncbi:MAG: hypothetical protein K5681_01520 [Treponema sp.]|nr:hypothetical protein [Treponema sp.]